MHEYRSILAAVCAGVGLLLLVVSIWKSSAGSRKSGPLTWLYTALFFIVAIVLWRRDAAPEPTVPPVVEQREQSSQVTQRIDSVATKPSPVTESKNKIEHSPAKVEDLKTTERHAAPVEATASRESKTGNLPPRESEVIAEPQERGVTAKKQSEREQESSDWIQAIDYEPAEVQDKIYKAIDSAFVWVTQFFEKHGTETTTQPKMAQKPVKAQDRKPDREPLHFPSVNFYLGTAELTGESLTSLKVLAECLKERKDVGVLEIQARVDSLGPEAFNFILTEARAATVRDYLISEGVSASQIVARGLGSSVLDAPKENSEVQFVVRR